MNMTRQSLNSLALAMLLIVCSLPALAADADVSEILQSQHALREKLDNPAGEYSRFGAEDLAKIRRAQDDIFQLLKGVSSLDQLEDAQKAVLSAELGEIKDTMTQNAGNRLVCYREHKPGTNLVAKRCETEQEYKARTRDSE